LITLQIYGPKAKIKAYITLDHREKRKQKNNNKKKKQKQKKKKDTYETTTRPK